MVTICKILKKLNTLDEKQLFSEMIAKIRFKRKINYAVIQGKIYN